MKNLSTTLLLASIFALFSCQDSSNGSAKKETDSVQSGLEGTREEASQLSNSTIDTSAGKTVKKADLTDSTTKTKDTIK